ncbi:hypothetical protein FSP39_025088 [Pinctada imbricata]|uniref:Endonuclease/exonuclease/phosphatase domain-containing protein n=1 Tax=Pinctada imbricata TaxID=66713 RepID=A0AA88YFT7_PINIB|nr:hypothetical protein FSP39_025088 [Pinctada imbricata]
MQGLVDKIHDNNTDSRQWWKTVNTLTNSNKTNVSIPPLNIDNTDLYVENDKAKTELFNTYFLSQQTIDDDNTTLPDVTTPPFSLCDITFDETDVTDVLSNLNISKATGPDTVHPILLRNASRELSPLLTKLFNLSLQTSIFPESWKLAHVSPIFEKDNSSQVKNY